MLGSILLSRDAADEAMMRLASEDFFLDAHARTFAAMRRVNDSGKPIDPMLLANSLKTAGDWETVGGAAFLVKLNRSVGSPAHLVHYAEIVSRKAMLRRVIQAAQESLQRAYAHDADPDDAVSSLEAACTDIATSRLSKRGAAVDLHTALGDALARIDSRMERKCGEGLLTGYTELDKMTGGLRPGELCIIAARTSQGKSVLALNVCENVALTAGKAVLLTSLEMSAGEIAERVLSSQSRTKLYQMRGGMLTEDRREALIDVASRLSHCRLTIDDAPSRSVSEISAQARKLKRSKDGLDLIVVDYLQLVRPENDRDSREQQVAKVVRRLKVLSREMGVPIVALAQINRDPEKGNKPRAPRLSDIRESGAIEQDADMVWFIHWPEGKPETAEAAEIHVAKQRNGPTGIVRLTWLRDYVRFDDVKDRPWEEQRQNWHEPQKDNEFDEYLEKREWKP